MYRWVRQRHMMGLRGRNFLEAPWAGGVVLLVCVIAAMLLANLPATKLYYHHLLETDLSLMIHSPDGVIDWIFPRGMTVEKFINDGLMVIFFFAVGLEIKREIVCGSFRPRAGPSFRCWPQRAACWSRRFSSRRSTTARWPQTAGGSPPPRTSPSP